MSTHRKLRTGFLAAGSLCIAAGLAVMALGPTGAVSGMSRAESEPFSDQACLDCHTDEDRLKELAVEEESPETLSSGPG